jgi:hypothetical protein
VPRSQVAESNKYQDQIATNNISFVSLNNISECISDGKIEFNLPGVVQSLSSVINDLKNSSSEGVK